VACSAPLHRDAASTERNSSGIGGDSAVLGLVADWTSQPSGLLRAIAARRVVRHDSSQLLATEGARDSRQGLHRHRGTESEVARALGEKTACQDQPRSSHQLPCDSPADAAVGPACLEKFSGDVVKALESAVRVSGDRPDDRGLRTGAATALFEEEGGNLSAVSWRLRHASQQTLHHYIQELRAAKTLQQLSAPTLARVRQLSSLFDGVLAEFSPVPECEPTQILDQELRRLRQTHPSQ
jgi:hypothetical protein